MAEIDMQAERAFWDARGLGAEFDKHVNGAAPAAPAPAAPQSREAELGDFMPPATAEAARHAIANGTPREAVVTMLDGFSAAAIDKALASAAAEPNEDLRTLNAGGFKGASDPSEINVSYDPITIAHLSPAEFMRFDAEIKGAMCEAGVPATAAASLIRIVADTAYKLQNMPAAERQAWEAKQKADLVAVMGVEDARLASQYALATFNRMADRHLDLAENLVRTGVLSDAMLVTVLAQTQDIAALRAAVAGGQSLASISNALR